MTSMIVHGRPTDARAWHVRRSRSGLAITQKVTGETRSAHAEEMEKTIREMPCDAEVLVLLKKVPTRSRFPRGNYKQNPDSGPTFNFWSKWVSDLRIGPRHKRS
jgi:hypothetical protein